MEESKGLKKVVSACDVEALKKCLEENKGDYVKCQSQIDAFKSSCSLSKHSSTTSLDPQTKTTNLSKSGEYSVTGEIVFYWVGS
ncbi:hypothetical protein OIU85_026722 [Salix viminalis]|uniref:Uncharacterized protein n=1 Tax=Salix viminalis TaxID=40686 RepID=A0A9Q0YYY3_SALVM|nr:hypothetical protein OIU85_026722 [Salix viminalis]